MESGEHPTTNDWQVCASVPELDLHFNYYSIPPGALAMSKHAESVNVREKIAHLQAVFHAGNNQTCLLAIGSGHEEEKSRGKDEAAHQRGHPRTRQQLCRWACSCRANLGTDLRDRNFQATRAHRRSQSV
jgi:hypothetical protein